MPMNEFHRESHSPGCYISRAMYGPRHWQQSSFLRLPAVYISRVPNTQLQTAKAKNTERGRQKRKDVPRTYFQLPKMKFPTVLLLLATAAVMLEFSCARRGRGNVDCPTVTTVVANTGVQTAGPLAGLLGNIGGFITRSAAIGTNCISRDCFIDPFNAGRCFTCLALVTLGGIGK